LVIYVVTVEARRLWILVPRSKVARSVAPGVETWCGSQPAFDRADQNLRREPGGQLHPEVDTEVAGQLSEIRWQQIWVPEDVVELGAL